MKHSIAEIADAIGAEAVGDTSMKVDGIAEPNEAGPTELALAMNRRYSDQLRAGRAGAAMLSEGEDWRSFGIRAAILVRRSRYSLALASAMFPRIPEVEEGIHASAALDSRLPASDSPASCGTVCLDRAGERLSATVA